MRCNKSMIMFLVSAIILTGRALSVKLQQGDSQSFLFDSARFSQRDRPPLDFTMPSFQEEECNHDDLQQCVKLVSNSRVRIPSNVEELDEQCLTYYREMACIHAWTDRCLTEEGQQMLHGHTAEMQGMMAFLCTNNTAIRKEFLKEPNCWAWILPAWPRCVEDFQVAVAKIVEPKIQQADDLPYYDREGELCRAQDNFLECVSHRGHLCTTDGIKMLHLMVCTLAEEIAPCVHKPCIRNSSPISIMSSLYTALYSIIFFLISFQY